MMKTRTVLLILVLMAVASVIAAQMLGKRLSVSTMYPGADALPKDLAKLVNAFRLDVPQLAQDLPPDLLRMVDSFVPGEYSGFYDAASIINSIVDENGELKDFWVSKSNGFVGQHLPPIRYQLGVEQATSFPSRRLTDEQLREASDTSMIHDPRDLQKLVALKLDETRIERDDVETEVRRLRENDAVKAYKAKLEREDAERQITNVFTFSGAYQPPEYQAYERATRRLGALKNDARGYALLLQDIVRKTHR